MADTSQECWTDTHLAYIYKVTIPLLLFLGLVHIAAIWCVKSQSTPGLFRYIKEYMAAGYARRHSGWEMHVMWLRALLVWLSLAYPFLDTFSQIMLFACILGWTTHARVIKMPYVSKWLNCLAIVAPTSVVIIVFTAAQGSEAELTALSTLGSAAVLGTGCIALFSNLSEGNKPYIVEVSQSQQNLSMLPLGDVSESLHVPPPPSSPDFMTAKEGEVLCD
ncbi:MAG: hypothetical protein J0651_03080 [Actinobacteria bacterium]|nr:hypothetical protein [Actinomycetota bacterium]